MAGALLVKFLVKSMPVVTVATRNFHGKFFKADLGAKTQKSGMCAALK